MELKISKSLSSGFIGNTYVGKFNGQNCLVKLSHILEKDLQTNPFNILNAFDEFARQYPNHFIKLISFNVIKDCKFKHTVPKWIKENPEKNKWYVKLHSSNVCIQYIYLPILDGTLLQWYKEQSVNPIKFRSPLYSFMCQFYYMHYIMSKSNWYHPDAHETNIMYKNTNLETIDIHIGKNKYTMSTYGKLWYLIDYDNIYNSKLSVSQKSNIEIRDNPHLFLALMINRTVFQPFWDQVNKQKINIPNEKKIVSLIKANATTRYLSDYLPKRTEPLTLQLCYITLCLLLETETHFKLMGLTDKSWNKYIEMVKTKQTVNIDDIVFCIKNITNHNRVIKLLISKM